MTVYVDGAAEQYVQLKIHNGGVSPILEIDAGLYERGIKLPGYVTNWHELMSLPAGHQSIIANIEMDQSVPDQGAAAGVVFIDGDYGIRWRRLPNAEPERLNG